MLWKNAFRQFWELPLPGPQLAEVAAACRPRLEPSLQPLRRLVGQGKKREQKQLHPKERVESPLPGEGGFPS